MTETQPAIVCRVFGKSAFATVIAGSLALTGCGPTYSPDTYSSNAVQTANKVDQGVVVGVRAIAISADSTLATATGGAAGGIAGSQVAGGAGGAIGALGGSVTGGLVGNALGHTTGDTAGFEYIVRKPTGDLLSVTQKDAAPLKVGQHVLIIEGPQARIVPDYTVAVDDTAHPATAGTPKSLPVKIESGKIESGKIEAGKTEAGAPAVQTPPQAEPPPSPAPASATPGEPQPQVPVPTAAPEHAGGPASPAPGGAAPSPN